MKADESDPGRSTVEKGLQRLKPARRTKVDNLGREMLQVLGRPELRLLNLYPNLSVQPRLQQMVQPPLAKARRYTAAEAYVAARCLTHKSRAAIFVPMAVTQLISHNPREITQNVGAVRNIRSSNQLVTNQIIDRSNHRDADFEFWFRPFFELIERTVLIGEQFSQPIRIESSNSKTSPCFVISTGELQPVLFRSFVQEGQRHHIRSSHPQDMTTYIC